MTMKDFAEHIIAVANKEGVTISNLQLQKVMFFTLKDEINKAFESNELSKFSFLYRMYDVPFEVWKYGPVERSIYEEYKPYGASGILDKYEENQEMTFLNETVLKYLSEEPFDLVNESHRELFWKNHEKDITGWRSNVKYSFKNVAGR